MNPRLILKVILLCAKPSSMGGGSKTQILNSVWRHHLDQQLTVSKHIVCCSFFWTPATQASFLCLAHTLLPCAWGYHIMKFLLGRPLLFLSSLCIANSLLLFGHQCTCYFFRNFFQECPHRLCHIWVLCHCEAPSYKRAHPRCHFKLTWQSFGQWFFSLTEREHY